MAQHTQVLFGTAAASADAVRFIVPRTLWVWMNLLHANVANQCLSLDEDMLNKRWRPIPSKRISQRSAHILRWALVPACVIISFVLRVPVPAAVLAVDIYIHEELNGASHWFTKNLCNAVGYACFNAGASLVCCGRFHEFSHRMQDFH